MNWVRKLSLFFAVGFLGLVVARAEQAADWRLELLKEKGLSAETPALEDFHKGMHVSEDKLTDALRFLNSEKFAERERAQKEIVLMGRKVLPLLRKLPVSDDPEVLMRLSAIFESLEAGGRWAEDVLLMRAVSSLLHERKNPGIADPEGKIFVQRFNKAVPSLDRGYAGLQFVTDDQRQGIVSNGRLHLLGKHDGEGDQQLLLDAKHLAGNEELPNEFRVEAKLGGGRNGAGTYHIGISIGNVRMLFHPGYRGGAFRYERVDNNAAITQNADMGFDPPTDKLVTMGINAKRLAGGSVQLDVMITSGNGTFRASERIQADVIGKLDHIGLDRSGRTGSDGIFDDLVVEWKP